jgi:hypothetical protein
MEIIMKTKLMSLILLAGLGSMPTTNFAATAPTADGLTHRKRHDASAGSGSGLKEASRTIKAGGRSKICTPRALKASLAILAFAAVARNFSIPTDGSRRLNGHTHLLYGHNTQYDYFNYYMPGDEAGHVYYTVDIDPYDYLAHDYKGNLTAEGCTSTPDKITYLFNPILSKMEEEDCQRQGFGKGIQYRFSHEKLFLYRVYLLSEQEGYASQFTDTKGRVDYQLVSDFVKTITDLRRKSTNKIPSFSDTCSAREGFFRKRNGDCFFNVKGKKIMLNRAIIRTIQYLWEKEHPTKIDDYIDSSWHIVSQRNRARLVNSLMMTPEKAWTLLKATTKSPSKYAAKEQARAALRTIQQENDVAAELARNAKAREQKKRDLLARVAEIKANRTAHFVATKKTSPHQGAKRGPGHGKQTRYYN